MAGLTTQSARVRSCIIDVLSACMPTNSISPITLDCGASTGVMPWGSVPASTIIFSLTVWRAL